MSGPRRWLIGLLVIAFIAITAIPLIPRPALPIDKARWTSATPHERDQLMSELGETGELNGRSVAAVMDLLGPPDYWDHRLIYDITAKGFSGSIVVNLGVDRRVKSVSRSGWSRTSDAPADRPFDRDAWRTSSVAQAAMVRDLSSGGALTGKSLEEVIELLGSAREEFGPRAVYSGRIEDMRRVSGPALYLKFEGEHVQTSEYGGS